MLQKSQTMIYFDINAEKRPLKPTQPNDLDLILHGLPTDTYNL
jgi:hypothetical protein